MTIEETMLWHIETAYQNLGHALFLAETHMNIKFSLIREGLVGLPGLWHWYLPDQAGLGHELRLRRGSFLPLKLFKVTKKLSFVDPGGEGEDLVLEKNKFLSLTNVLKVPLAPQPATPTLKSCVIDQFCVVGRSPAKNCLHQTDFSSKNPPRATTYVKYIYIRNPSKSSLETFKLIRCNQKMETRKTMKNWRDSQTQSEAYVSTHPKPSHVSRISARRLLRCC